MADGAANAYGMPGGWWGAAGTGLGALSDIYSFIQNLQRSQQQQQLYDILSSPTKFAAYVNKMFQPMGAAENAAVQRDLGANWATMTGGAPGGAMNQFIADALAKIESSRYQDTSQNALRALTGAGGQIGQQAPIGMMGNILKSLLTLKQLQPAGGGDQTGITTPGWGDYRAGERTPYQPPTTDTSTVSTPPFVD